MLGENMKKKLSFLGQIAIIVLSIALFAFGVYAASNVSVTTSGTVAFNATDVYARITRTVEGVANSSEYNDIDITYNAGTPDNQHDIFENENLVFVNASTNIKMTFTIENLATESGRNIYILFEDNSTPVANSNVTKNIEALNGNLVVGPTQTKVLTIYMSIDDPNYSALANYDFKFTLTNTSPTYVEVSEQTANFVETTVTNAQGQSVNGYKITGLKDVATTSPSQMNTVYASDINPSTITNLAIPGLINTKPVLEIAENALEADIIYACGPTPMLRAIKNYAEANGIECYISLEERMACGIGACLACVCKSKEKGGRFYPLWLRFSARGRRC